MSDRLMTRGGPAGNYLDFGSVSPALSTTLELAADALHYPYALLHILDGQSQYVLAAHGIPGLAGTISDRQNTTCRYVVDTGAPLSIPDAYDSLIDMSLLDPILSAGMATYVGVPLFSRENTAIGTLCLTDTVRHDSGEHDQVVLEKFAQILEEQLELQRDRTTTSNAYSIDDIVGAMGRNEIRPWFQAIVDPRTRRTYGYEALCRWVHPTDGVLGPGRFLPTVRTTDIMLDLDLQVMEQSMAMMAALEPTATPTVLHANIDGAHLIRPQRIELLTSAITDSDFPADRLRLELIESAALDDSSAAHAICALRALGAQIVIDDVGRGWSSLSRMVTWPIDGFKIDASLTAGLGTSVVDHLLTGLIEHADANDLVVIAEGIETARQVESLVSLHCPLAQGYHFQLPLEGPEPV